MNLYRILADCTVAVHFAFVAFVVLGLVAIWLGLALKKPWARNFWFRTIHMLFIAVVVVESLLEQSCPLTDLEDYFRDLAGETFPNGSFIGRFLHNILFLSVSHRTLMMIYCVFGSVVLLTFIFAPPRINRKNNF
jgi:hypothetical protein